MATLIGKSLGPYEVTAALGSGGMGEVYRAKDTRLGREVAVKVLPENLAGDPHFKERFEREARTISQLAHAHICTLYDVGHQDGTDYLVMELLEGETLADRLVRGALPPDQVLKFGIQLADALGFAHRHGVVHRDLKPGNVMLTKAGVKLMDFGLAKESVAQAAMGASAMTAMMTGSKPLTTEGTMVGTFQYMAPEQLEGKEADARTDIFSLGVVLYEMATSKRAFAGKTQASVIASILASEPPPISMLQPMTPPALERVIRGCMAKDADDRIQTAHDLKMQLQWIVEGGSQANVPTPVAERRKVRAQMGWAVAAVAAVVMFAAGYFIRSSPEPATIVASVVVPPGSRLDFNGGATVLSPDGKALVFAASKDGSPHLWVRPLNGDASHVLEGTKDAFYPFWSPDGKSIAFFGNGHLSRVDAAGGPVQTIATAEDGRGGSWGKDGVILFAPGSFTAIKKVSASGGAVEPVTEALKATSNRFPVLLPDGKHFLYFSGSLGNKDNGIYAGSLDDPPSKNHRLVMAEDSAAIFVEPGYLMFVRNGSLMAQEFNASKLALQGAAVPIAENIQYQALRWMGNYSAAGDLLIYRSLGAQKSQLTWLDTEGREQGKVGEPGEYRWVFLSPDSKRAISEDATPGQSSSNLWMFDLTAGTRQKFTFQSGKAQTAAWSPDGSKVAYVHEHDNTWDVYLKPSSGAGAEELIYSSPQLLRVYSFTPDGKSLLCNGISKATQKMEVWTISLIGDHKPNVVISDPNTNYVNPAVSKNGRWLAYSSDESHRFEIYVVPFPAGSGRWQLTTETGWIPTWINGDKQLLIRTGDSKLNVVDVDASGPSLGTGSSHPFLGGRSADEMSGYAVAADGKRVLVGLYPEGMGTPITLVTHWTSMMKK